MLTARWPGNVRQLQHAVERAVIRASMNGKSDILFRPEDENEDIPIGTEHQEEDLSNLDALNKNHILRALHKCKGRISGKYGAALLLGINPNTLRSRMKRMGISAKEY